ncbi:hypothetical protein IAR50_007000 [Cryptococcus sp. DSM 104548]
MSQDDKMDRSFLTADVDDLLRQLSTEEKIALLAGKDWWNTVDVPRLNIPSVKVTDGPGGARGDSFYHMTPASALPSATALASTFSLPLLQSAGQLLALEVLARNATALLAPTINIARSPLGGRAFESFSEDPTLAGQLAGAYVRGLQEGSSKEGDPGKGGVGAVIKHFVGNDQEHERMGEDSLMSPRALREIYLRPFQIALRLSSPSAFMTAYNKLNGTHCSENEWLLEEVLRKEWGFEGLVMSDWYGTYSVSESINAGMNLEMPGPGRWRAEGLVQHLINAHKIDLRQLDKVAGGVLKWVQKLARANEELVYSPASPEKTRTESQKEDAKFLRQLAGESIVLLKNEKSILPIQSPSSSASSPTKVAVIGPNAKAKILTGGGSATLRSAWSSSPWEGLSTNTPEGIELSHAQGAFTGKFMPTLDASFTCPDGSSGFQLSHYSLSPSGSREQDPAFVEKWDDSNMFLADFRPPNLTQDYITQLDAIWTPEEGGEYEFGVSVTGKGWVWVDDELVVDVSMPVKRGSSFFGSGSVEVKGKVKVEKGKYQRYAFKMVHDTRPPASNEANTPFRNPGIRLGFAPVISPEQLLSNAVSLAKESDIALLIVGLNADWESEGYDRPDLSLPLNTDRLISAVVDANPNTIVVIQAGSAVSMPWLDKVKGVLHAWYLGNETGSAIADIVYGFTNPSGRLPLTFPKREIDIAAHLNSKSARTKVYYEEGIWVGYKHFNARAIEPLFPFGHGLSYTSFSYANLRIVTPPPRKVKVAGADGWKVGVAVDVKNEGEREGKHTVLFFLTPPEETETGLKHPAWTLQGFEKVELAPGESKTVKVVFDKYAVSHWDELWDTWRAELGEWTVRIGVDAGKMWEGGQARFKIEEELEWKGL